MPFLQNGYHGTGQRIYSTALGAGQVGTAPVPRTYTGPFRPNSEVTAPGGRPITVTPGSCRIHRVGAASSAIPRRARVKDWGPGGAWSTPAGGPDLRRPLRSGRRSYREICVTLFGDRPTGSSPPSHQWRLMEGMDWAEPSDPARPNQIDV